MSRAELKEGDWVTWKCDAGGDYSTDGYCTSLGIIIMVSPIREAKILCSALGHIHNRAYWDERCMDLLGIAEWVWVQIPGRSLCLHENPTYAQKVLRDLLLEKVEVLIQHRTSGKDLDNCINISNLEQLSLRLLSANEEGGVQQEGRE